MSEKKTVTAQVPEKKDKKTGKVIQEHLGPSTVAVDYPTNLKEAEDMYGAEALLSNAFANWRVVVQGNIRTSLKAGMTPEQIQTKLGTAKMGIAVVTTIDPQAAYIAQFQAATPEKQKEMLKMLQQKAAGK